jgi:hypothetical protein
MDLSDVVLSVYFKHPLGALPVFGGINILNTMAR